MNIRELAKLLDATALEFADGSEEISYPAAIEEAKDGAISFIANPYYERHLLSTKATAVIVSEYLSASKEPGVHVPALIHVKSPYEAFARALEIFKPYKKLLEDGIHPSASIHPTASVHSRAKIGAFVTVCERVVIGEGAEILPGVYIGADAIVGKATILHPNVVVYDHVVIGDNVIVGAGSVIGFDGFGYVPMGDGSYHKIPQIGRVVLEDEVEIGANTTIDRATIAETRIKRGAKLDNLIQIAHNVEIGENTVIAAQAGISGSTKIGRQNIIAGQVGIVGHIETAEHVIVGAQSGISKSLSKAGTYFGSPARNHRDALRLEGAIRSLPELSDRVKRLEELLAEHEAQTK